MDLEQGEELGLRHLAGQRGCVRATEAKNTRPRGTVLPPTPGLGQGSWRAVGWLAPGGAWGLPCRLFPLVLVQVGGGEVWGLTTGAKALFCFTAETMLAGEKEKMPEELLQLEGRLVEEAMVGLDGTTKGQGEKKNQCFSWHPDAHPAQATLLARAKIDGWMVPLTQWT